jgi:hypothetical protein
MQADSKFSSMNELSVIEKLTQVDREATKFDFDTLNLSPDTEK